MKLKSILLATTLAAALSGTSAGAVTITTSLSAFDAAIAPNVATDTQITGLFNEFAFPAPIVTTIPLAGSVTLGLSTPTEVAQPAPVLSVYPWSLSDGYTGDLFVPIDGNGNQVTSITVTPQQSSPTALAFEVVPFSAATNGPPNTGQSGPYNLTVTIGNQSQTVSEPGANMNGVTIPAFFGIYGGPVPAFTISTSDPMGLAFGNFLAVPEPSSLLLLLSGITALTAIRRRTS